MQLIVLSTMMIIMLTVIRQSALDGQGPYSNTEVTSGFTNNLFYVAKGFVKNIIIFNTCGYGRMGEGSFWNNKFVLKIMSLILHSENKIWTKSAVYTYFQL